MRVVIIGSRGQMARALLKRAPQASIEIAALCRPQFDLTESRGLTETIQAAKPDVIINSAGYTAVDKAEFEEALATKINGLGAGKLAQAASRLEIPIISLSTDYLFDGSLERPYREDDAPNPINAYGRSKLVGEEAVRAATPAHVILRTSWLYSEFGTNFVRTMLQLSETNERIGVVADQFGQPTSAFDLADAVLAICVKLLAQPLDLKLYGTFHLAGTEATCWADFAERIFAEAESYGRHPVDVTRLTTAQYPRPARRPANSRLNTQKLAKVYGISLPGLSSSLPVVMMRLLAGEHPCAE